MLFPCLNHAAGASLAVQWLRLHTPNAGDTGSILGWGTKIPHAAALLHEMLVFKERNHLYIVLLDVMVTWLH